MVIMFSKFESICDPSYDKYLIDSKMEESFKLWTDTSANEARTKIMLDHISRNQFGALLGVGMLLNEENSSILKLTYQ